MQPDRQQRIAFVSAVGATGGGERVLMELARGAKADAMEAEIFCLRDGSWAQGAWGTDVAIHAYKNGYRIRYPWTVLAAARWLRRSLREFRPTIIHANHASWWITAWAARGLDAKTVWHLHDYPDSRDLPTRVGVRSLPSATVFTTRRVASGYPELSRSDHRIIAPVTIDTAAFREAERDDSVLNEYGLSGKVYFATVCRWQSHKGLHDLVSAVGERTARPTPLDAAVFVLVGSPSNAEEQAYQDSVLAQMDRMNVRDRFVLVPRCTDQQLRSLYASSIALVHPALSEGFGLVILEALSLGVPVIACDAAGPEEILRRSEAGLLVRGGDATALREAMARILSDPAQRERYRQAGLARAAQLSRGEMVHQTLALYNSLTDDRQQRPRVSPQRSRGESPLAAAGTTAST